MSEITEPEAFGYSCPEPGCDGSASGDGYPTLGEALAAARAHRQSHADAALGIVTYEKASVA